MNLPIPSVNHSHRHLPRGKHEEDGQSLVEFAFVATFLVLFLMGVFDLGRAVYYYNAIGATARETARQAVLYMDDSCTDANDTAVKNQALDAVVGVPISASDISISPACPRTVGDVVTVHITVTFTPVTPILAAFGGSTFTMSAQSKMRVQ